MLQASANKVRVVQDPEEDGMPLVEAGGVQQELCRTTSCVDDPQATALTALKGGNHRLLSDMLTEAGTSVDKEYPEESHRTLLELAVQKKDAAAVRLLLSAGAQPGRVNSVLGVSPLHMAAGSASPGLVDTLLKAGASPEVRDKAGRSPLHRAVAACSTAAGGGSSQADALRCMESLLGRAQDVDLADHKGGQTPLYLAAKSGCYEACRLLVEAGADPDKECRGETVRSVVVAKFSLEQVGKLSLDKRRTIANNTHGQVKLGLFDLADEAEINGENLKKWEEALNRASLADLDSNNGEFSLVQLLAKRGLDLYLSAVLARGADPNAVTQNKGSPGLLLAAQAGHAAALSQFVKHSAAGGCGGKRLNLLTKEPATRCTVLHLVLMKPLHNLHTAHKPDYESCLASLLDRGLVAESTVASLVNCQDSLGNTALHYAVDFWDQGTVAALLNLGANIGVKNQWGEAPVGKILPDTMQEFLDTSCLKASGNPTNEDFSITFKYDFLAPPVENYPGVTSAAVESLRRRSSLSAKPEVPQVPPLPETDVLWYMSQSADHRHLLKHPVITSFMALKWGRISCYYNSNMLFYSLLVASLTAYILSYYSGVSVRLAEPVCEGTFKPGPLWFLVTILIAVLCVRELFQFSISPARYFTSVENLLEVGLMSVTSVLLWHGNPGCQLSVKRELAAAALLLSWIEWVTMVGRHPVLFTYNTYLTMFYRVLKTFLLFLTWYSFFILAFAFGFYILLQRDDGSEERDYPYFDYLGLCVVKTFSMFVGELEFSDIPLSSGFSYVYFLAFIFLIVVVLMNLLNGLAVSDTGHIREEAEIHAHVSRVSVISHAEATLLGDPLNLLSSPVPRPRCGGLLHRLTGATSLLLFYSYLPDKQLVVYPNRKTSVCSPSCFSFKEVGQEILQSARDLAIKMQTEANKKLDLERALSRLTDRQAAIENKMEQVLNKLETLTKLLAP